MNWWDYVFGMIGVLVFVVSTVSALFDLNGKWLRKTREILRRLENEAAGARAKRLKEAGWLIDWSGYLTHGLWLFKTAVIMYVVLVPKMSFWPWLGFGLLFVDALYLMFYDRRKRKQDEEARAWELPIAPNLWSRFFTLLSGFPVFYLSLRLFTPG